MIAIDTLSARLLLHPFSVEEAERVVRREPHPADAWALDYPLEDELDPLRSFLEAAPRGSSTQPFGLYQIRCRDDGLAIGGLGFFGPADEFGAVELGFGLVPRYRGRGLATEALIAALTIARRNGALTVKAHTTHENVASQRVLQNAGFAEAGRDPNRDGALIYYRVDLAERGGA